ncbi:hypothetical protein N7507_007084 [Penicillium longicatenatum]|nr:hypothetical protein N7507_007084 [Penicillium longicatenatum]
MASICVKAARKMLSMLPNRTDASLLFKLAPWWCVLHYIIQSTTIILVEFFMRTESGIIEAVDLLDDIRKAVYWLREIATRDPSSQRAWSVCVDILSQRGLDFCFGVDHPSTLASMVNLGSTFWNQGRWKKAE